MGDELTEYIQREIDKVDRIHFALEKTQEGQRIAFDKQLGRFMRGEITAKEWRVLQEDQKRIDDLVTSIEKTVDHYDAIDKWKSLIGDVANSLDERGSILAYQDLIGRYRETLQYNKELQARIEFMGRFGVDDNSKDKFWREKWLIKKIGLGKDTID